MADWRKPSEEDLLIGDYWFILKGEDTVDAGMFIRNRFVTADGITHPIEDVAVCLPVTESQKGKGKPSDGEGIAFLAPQYACLVLGTYYRNLDDYYLDAVGETVILYEGYDFLDDVDPFVKWEDIEEWYSIPSVK